MDLARATVLHHYSIFTIVTTWAIVCAVVVSIGIILAGIRLFHAAIKTGVAPVPSNRQGNMANLELLKLSQTLLRMTGALDQFDFRKVVALSLVFGVMTGILGPGNPLALWSSFGVGVMTANIPGSGWLEVLVTSVGSILVGNAVEWVLPEAFKNGKLLNNGLQK